MISRTPAAFRRPLHPLLLVGAMLLTGALNIVLGVPVWMQLLHLLLADVLWITYVLAAADALREPVGLWQPADSGPRRSDS